MTSESITSIEETDLLIQLVRDRPALYDKSRPEFKDVAYKQLIWQEIADVMGYTSQDVYKRWLTLRGCYSGEFHKIKNNPACGPSTWHLYDSMNFLAKQIIERKRILPHIYSSVKVVDAKKKPNDVKIESFDSELDDSSWDNRIGNSVREEIGYGDKADTHKSIRSVEPDVVIVGSKRRRSASPGIIPAKIRNNENFKLKKEIPDSAREIGNAAKQSVALGTASDDDADKLFGKMIGAMIAELNDGDKNRAKIHILSYLCTHGYKIN